ncbi:hypothetical protein Pmani_026884 [Petrolisthes manimaculis]|uniref:Uncharacterized protein n=1 Tax=Petrolisthes manimaculis TaxID=1843537 RepID=A0AAE1P3A4_9EUCA|nr:hypothetical protein Pmani_026884 [Petrolisthes manimaculis]
MNLAKCHLWLPTLDGKTLQMPSTPTSGSPKSSPATRNQTFPSLLHIKHCDLLTSKKLRKKLTSKKLRKKLTSKKLRKKLTSKKLRKKLTN